MSNLVLPPLAPKRKVLIVDDDEATRTLMLAVLEGPEDCVVFSAHDGYSALQAANSILPDVVVLDVRMPGIDGIEVCRRLRRNAATSESKIVMVSACAQANERAQGFEAGADEYLTKPFQTSTLREFVVGMFNSNAHN